MMPLLPAILVQSGLVPTTSLSSGNGNGCIAVSRLTLSGTSHMRAAHTLPC
jgi:hypothetical protein